MVSPMKWHPRLCSVCDRSAENPFIALWNFRINERISLCSKLCFNLHNQAFNILNQNESPKKIIVKSKSFG